MTALGFLGVDLSGKEHHDHNDMYSVVTVALFRSPVHHERTASINMPTYPLLSLLLTFFVALAAAVDAQRQVSILAWPLSAPKAQPFASISHTSTNASVTSYTPPTILASAEIVRLGFYHKSGLWSGIATSASNFASSRSKRLQLHVRPNGEVYHLAFKVTDLAPQVREQGVGEGLDVEVVQDKPGPAPALNKPVVVREDGQVEGKEPEKTFLQKYRAHHHHSKNTLANSTQVLVGNRPVRGVPAGHGRERRVTSPLQYKAGSSPPISVAIYFVRAYSAPHLFSIFATLHQASLHRSTCSSPPHQPTHRRRVRQRHIVH